MPALLINAYGEVVSEEHQSVSSSRTERSEAEIGHAKSKEFEIVGDIGMIRIRSLSCNERQLGFSSCHPDHDFHLPLSCS